MRTTRPIWIGVSLKAYFGRAAGRRWFEQVAKVAGGHRARELGVHVFVLPDHIQLDEAVAAFAGTGVQVGAQNVSAHPHGAFTGEIPAALLAESGAAYAEIGHFERRTRFGETDRDVSAKVRATLGAGLRPLICLGEAEWRTPEDAASLSVMQLRAALADAQPAPVLIAYEPAWSIGASEPASPTHITTVTRALREELRADPARAGSGVIYGGSAGPGLLTTIAAHVDGLFLGRSAHDPAAFADVLDEAADLLATQ